ncbi:MAG TPA: acetyl-CoA hydrolase/transferase C-terminal domain-containing protein [Planctomycetota bacterium]|nr:acetyl-CoA hydrolase/transferase C-terminal domain-containing protein [Planctomycetota bacterium]
MSTLRTSDAKEAVEAILARVGPAVACGTPLGLGKPVALINALYARVKSDASLSLDITTALSLEIPRPHKDLERRFLEPVVKRAFDGVPELDYLRDLRAGDLPANIRLFEFYFRAGAMLDLQAAQQNYISTNYTHVTRDVLARGVNAILCMVSERGGRYSLSCNPDITLDLARAMRASGVPCVVAGMVNRKLPFMLHDAEVGADFFDVLLDAPMYEQRLFGVPSPAVELADHAIGVLAASLVKDGGTLQLGIGAFGDAVAHWLRVRHTEPATFSEGLRAVDGGTSQVLIERLGGRERFVRGLFGSSEMFSWGLMTLYRAGVIRRRADGDAGPVMQAAFFLGPEAFYRALHDLPENERELFLMTSVARINDIYGEEELVRRRLRDARFINSCMKATIFGAVASDGLEDGRVVSGVGGQYNFVAMAHELAGARSILLLRSTYESTRGFESNILFSYGSTTIPRHLRDIVITEYGIADLRGRTDFEVATAMIQIADARFQDGLVERAKAVGKLPPDWRVPDRARTNTPEHLATRLEPLATRGFLPAFPLGTDFDAEEQRLMPALQWLKKESSTLRGRLAIAARVVGARPTTVFDSALQRMGLGAPRGIKEIFLRRAVILALQRTKVRERPPGKASVQDGGGIPGTRGQDYRIYRSKAEFSSSAFIEIGAGKFSGEHWQEGCLFIEEEAFFVAEGILGKHFPSYDHLAFQDIPRLVGKRVIAAWRDAAARIPQLSTAEIHSLLNLDSVPFGPDLVAIGRDRSLIAAMLNELADACDEFYERDEWVRILGV